MYRNAKGFIAYDDDDIQFMKDMMKLENEYNELCLECKRLDEECARLEEEESQYDDFYYNDDDYELGNVKFNIYDNFDVKRIKDPVPKKRFKGAKLSAGRGGFSLQLRFGK